MIYPATVINVGIHAQAELKNKGVVSQLMIPPAYPGWRKYLYDGMTAVSLNAYMRGEKAVGIRRPRGEHTGCEIDDQRGDLHT